MLTHLRPALVLTVLLTLLTGLAYPLAVTGVAQLAFAEEANGSLIRRNGTVIGSRLIAQGFSGAGYFHPRPSATTAPDPTDPDKSVPMPYHAGNSGGSNLGPTAKGLLERVGGDVATLKAENPRQPVPIELVTSSASGLDPHLSPQAALFQVPRIAKARQRPEAELEKLVIAQTNPRFLGIFGEPTVNVLALNLALDELK